MKAVPANLEIATTAVNTTKTTSGESGERCLRRLTVKDDRADSEFDVVMTRGALDTSNLTLKQCLEMAYRAAGKRVHAIFSPSAYRHYGSAVAAYFARHSIPYTVTVLPHRVPSEENKSLESLADLIEQLDQHRPVRGEALCLFGGGVVMDLGGFLASTWRRGEFEYVAVPTTPIAAVDAAISPKTGINIGRKKNRLGTYCAPAAVVIDVNFFRTVSGRAALDGVAEMIKVAVIGDSKLFEEFVLNGPTRIQELFQGPAGEHIIWRSAELFVSLKSDARYKNSKQSIRGFGHIFSRELESAAAFRLSHGEAVSIEMRIAIHLASLVGVLSRQDRETIIECFDLLRLAPWADIVDADKLWNEVFEQRFRAGESFEFPVPDIVGNGIFLEKFNIGDFRSAIAECKRHSNGRGLSIAIP